MAQINFRAERSATTIAVTFSLTPDSGTPPLTVSFTITSTTGEIDTYEWDFGDGDTFSGADAPDHTYSVDGVYTVTLTVTGPAGTASDSHNVTVVTGGGGGAPYDNIVDAYPLIQDGLEHTKDFDITGFTMETNEDTEGYDFPEVWATFDLTDYPPGCVTVTAKTETISGTVIPEIDLWAVDDATFSPAAPDFSKVSSAGEALGDGTTTPAEQTWTIDPYDSATRIFYLWISDWNFDLTAVGVQRLTYTIQRAPDSSDKVLRADGRSGATASARKNFSAENEVWVTASVAFSSCAAEDWRTFFNAGSADLLEINYNGTSQVVEGIYINKTGASGGDPIAWVSATDNVRAATPAPVGEIWQLLEFHYVASTFSLTAYVEGAEVWTWDFGSGGSDATGVTIGQAGAQTVSDTAFAYVNDVKVGTTRGGTEIFEDDFSSGDLSNWDVATGLVDVGPNPFPVVSGTNVADFGAIGDGVTNDTAALQAAFNSGDDVYSDPGKTYLITSTLTLTHGANFQGSTITGGGINTVTGLDARLTNVTVDNASIGIRVSSGHAMVCVGCYATNCTWGFYIAGGASGLTSISGGASLNTIGLEIHSANGGEVPTFDAHTNSNFGIICYDMVGWHFGTITSNDNGNAAALQTGTGFEFWQNCHGNLVDDYTGMKNPGYGLAFNHSSNDNDFTTVYLDGAGALDSDPGMTFADGSSDNRIANLTVKNHTVGVRFGENDSGLEAPCSRNTVTNMIGAGLAYGGIRFEHGDDNEVTVADLTNIRTVDSGFSEGGIEFSPNGFPTDGNSVGAVAMHGAQKPTYAIHYGPEATNNHVDSGTVLYNTAQLLDEGSGNTTNVTG